MKRRLLIVSPHFAPVNAPDMHRVRLILPHLRAHGWEPTVLALTPESVEGAVLDPLLEKTFPADIRIVRVAAMRPQSTRWAGVGGLWLRGGRALTRAGDALLAGERFDLVFFSTTQFSAFSLGPRWRRRFGVPYVLDYQDPWVSDFYARTGTRPPGGSLKYALSQWRARRQEPRVVRAASGIVAVSDDYRRQLARAYPWFDPRQVETLPFGASEADLTIARAHAPAQPRIDFSDGGFHHVYAGRCAENMTPALTALFRAFKHYQHTDPANAARTWFHFIGTDYAPPPLGRALVTEVAQCENVAEHVREHCYRVPYFEALHYLCRADALIAIGSSDPGYSASKIYSCVLARRPMMLVYHAASPVLDFARRVGVGPVFGYATDDDINPLAKKIHRDWFTNLASRRYAPFDARAFQPFTAAALTDQLVRTFDRAVDSPSSLLAG
jgi:hypothetical protein